MHEHLIELFMRKLRIPSQPCRALVALSPTPLVLVVCSVHRVSIEYRWGVHVVEGGVARFQFLDDDEQARGEVWAR